MQDKLDAKLVVEKYEQSKRYDVVKIKIENLQSAQRSCLIKSIGS